MESCLSRTKLKQPRSVAAPRAGRSIPLAAISSLNIFQYSGGQQVDENHRVVAAEEEHTHSSPAT